MAGGHKFNSSIVADQQDQEERTVKMQRHYFIGNSLDDLEVLEQQLEAAGIGTPQIHVLSRDDAEVHQHRHLHEVESFMKTDVVHSTTRGAVVGILASALVLATAYYAGWTETAAGWLPFAFLALIVLGFCTWEGGFLGIQRPNHNFVRFDRALKDGKHIFFVDLAPDQKAALEQLLHAHPQVQLAGTGSSTRSWLIALQGKSRMIRHS
jgi:hypothetical protein